ncbi:MAG TPA: hypothetical protein VMY41_13300 [Thermohalobaculum sp.]|nr:hypothetical protein [Thermohalobaculum sp.]
MRQLGALWRGALPLGEAFWIYAFLIGATVNIAATAAMLGALAANLNGVLALAIHLSSLPYNVAMVVGVWRSAAHHAGARHHAEAARISVAIWAVMLSVI